MGTALQPHLTADELDALHTGAMALSVQKHLETCTQCFEMAQKDRALVVALAAVPLLTPQDGFPDRVMARVTVVQPFSLWSLAQLPQRVLANRRLLAMAASWTVVLGGAMLASVVWSMSNTELLAAWSDHVVAQGSQWFWLGLRAIAANLAEQPGYEQARAVVTSPGRLTGLLAGLLVAYASGVLALRHLVAIPTRSMHDVRA